MDPDPLVSALSSLTGGIWILFGAIVAKALIDGLRM